MKNILLSLVAVAMIISAIFYCASPASLRYQYPGSELIFIKYYPENEILGMANDKNWREVEISNDSVETISAWYEKTFSNYTLVENSADVHCTRKSWQEDKIFKLRLVACDHGDYRSILTIFN